METEQTESSNQESNNSNPPQPPVPPDIINPKPNEEPNPNDRQSSQEIPTEPTKIIIVDDKREKSKHDFWANWISFGNLLLTIAVFVITFLLFKQAVRQNSIAEGNLSLAVRQFDRTLAENRSAKIEQNKKDVEDAVNRRNQLVLDSESTQAQIKSVNAQTLALKQSQKDFELENRPFIIATKIRADTTFPQNKLTISFDLINEGKFPAKILSTKMRFAIGVDINRIDRETPLHKHFSNEFIAASAYLFAGMDMNDIEEIYKYEIKNGNEKIFIFIDMSYETFGTLNKYSSNLVYELTYAPNIQLRAIKN